jgi:sigma-54 dependent transcriptional regulator, acetoin dehydrogenase operon transcriptional activator AcoR
VTIGLELPETRGELEVMHSDTQAVTDPSVREVLTASWKRSMEHGLRRQDRVLFTNPVTKALERRTLDENHRLLTHVMPEMVRLYGSLGSARWLALCVNAHGRIISSVGDPLSAPGELRALMHPGRSLLESEIGTTAPGCVLEAGLPVVISREQHYLHELTNFFCVSAPILAPDGNLAGALDISGLDVHAPSIASDLVMLAARVVENNMLRDMSDCILLRFHFDDRLIDTPFEGLLAVMPDGRVVGVNRTARKLMALPAIGAAPVSLESYFETSIEQIQDKCSRASEPIKLPSHTGPLTYVRVDGMRSQRAFAIRAQAPRAPTLPRTTNFIVQDEALTRAMEKATRALACGLPVLLEGETGTGKEMFARALHRAVRQTGPFLAINCAAIPEGLIEAELFGYADGAFTGGRKGGAKGKIELAHGGVLFLDEIGDMPLAMQSRLLRVVQERTIMRIGGDREIPVDTLFISATHQCLKELTARGAFREDLYYRLNGFTLRLPPLRQRADIADIVEALLRQAIGIDSGGSEQRPLGEIITSQALARLLKHPWPGNIRQLQQTLRSLTALRGSDEPIDLGDLPEEFQSLADTVERGDTDPERPLSTLAQAEEDFILRALRDHDENISATARALGISRTTLYTKLKIRESSKGEPKRSRGTAR